MPGPIVHLASTAPLSLGYKWLNVLTLFVASLFPDFLAILISPLLIFVFGIKGPKLNWFFSFFDKSIMGGSICAVILIGIILTLIKFFPRLSIPFKWKQNYSKKAIIISAFLGVALHVLLDKTM